MITELSKRAAAADLRRIFNSFPEVEGLAREARRQTGWRNERPVDS